MNDVLCAIELQQIWLANEALRHKYEALEEAFLGETMTAELGLLYEFVFGSSSDGCAPSIDEILAKIADARQQIAARDDSEATV